MSIRILLHPVRALRARLDADQVAAEARGHEQIATYRGTRVYRDPRWATRTTDQDESTAGEVRR